MALSRRQFLLRSAAASGAAAAGAALPGCAPGFEPAPFVDVAAPVNGTLTVPFAAAPQLRGDGAAVIARAPGIDPVLVVRAPGGTLAATAATCTHLGCPVGLDGGEIVCPCHLSRFGLDGTVLHPPARANLAVYAADFSADGTAVLVNLLAGDPGFPALVNGQVLLTFAQFPALASPGGSVTGKPAGAREPILVMALAGGGYAAVEALCTHLGCRVGFNPNVQDVECPCHGSRFATGGAVVNGPATRPLRALAAVAGTDGVTVTIPA
ncbi:MAG TPA: Rieske 2Fe-2S domain-containing protein [Anaeromyxobacteraceae bacterium]|nr:Rieske 2Fe-2S domain-containing protein [Anaeromyxobacteraceae bacterium]